jgi:hypothetical protein
VLAGRPGGSQDTGSRRQRMEARPQGERGRKLPRTTARQAGLGLLHAGVGNALLGEARFGGAVQFLRGGLVLAAFLGEARQRGAVQALAGGLNRAAIVGHGGAGEAERYGNDGYGLHVSLPENVMATATCRVARAVQQ